MDVQAIRDIQFREKLRGYHPEDVDAFVAEVVSTVEELDRRAKAAEQRATTAEHRAEAQQAEAGATVAASAGGESSTAPSELEDSLRRTLVLAQRTADAAIAEARQEAARLVADAHQERDAVAVEAAELRARLQAEVEAEQREERQRLTEERTQLLAQLSALVADIDGLEQHVAGERERLRVYFTDQLQRVEESELRLRQPPPISDVAAEHLTAPAEPARAAGPADDGRLEATTTAAAASVVGLPQVDLPGEAGVDAGLGDDHLPESDTAALDVDVRDDFGDEPPEAPLASTSPGEDDDPFLAELRLAADDDEPLGPRDTPVADPEADGFDLFASGANAMDSGGFASRLRRRR